MRTQSAEWFIRGRALIPDGVSSPMRTFAQVGGNPIVAQSGKGARIFDVDGREYVDFLNSFGALILGHAHPKVAAAIAHQAVLGTSYGISTVQEYELADKIVASTPAIEQVRFVCSGTEAVMTATRIARAHTGRNLIVKFGGAYHGHSDALLASPQNIDTAVARNKGITRGIAARLNREVVLCDYNDMEGLETLFTRLGADIAAVLVEPVATNMGLVLPLPGFHQLIRTLCDRHGALFIFDEVVTGFRFHFGGVCTSFGVDPDLVTFGKIIGGGTPVGAYAGKKRFMQNVAIGNGVFQSGTFAANPLTIAAGNAMLDVLAQPGFYDALESKGAFLEAALNGQFAARDIAFKVTRHGALLGVAFRASAEPMRSYQDVKTQQYDVFRHVHQKLMARGFLIPPALEEPLFLSAAHTRADLAALADAMAESIEAALAVPA